MVSRITCRKYPLYVVTSVVFIDRCDLSIQNYTAEGHRIHCLFVKSYSVAVCRCVGVVLCNLKPVSAI